MMENPNEKTFFKSRNVKITSLRAILYGKSYLLSEITSAKVITNSSVLNTISWSTAGIIGLLIIAFSCVLSINFDLIVFSIIGIFLVGGAIRAIRTPPKPTTFIVQVMYRSSSTSILETENRALAESIVGAVHEALNNRLDIKSNH